MGRAMLLMVAVLSVAAFIAFSAWNKTRCVAGYFEQSQSWRPVECKKEVLWVLEPWFHPEQGRK
jgi:hypothetical protein